MKAAGDLSQGLNSNTKAITYAGTKDKRAKTTQWFCIRKREPEKISKAADMKKSIHVGNFTFKDEPLKLGHLSGNRFRIALRHIVHPESDIELSLQSLKENGFINYYGLQRFGNNSTVPTHQVGLALIKGQFKEVHLDESIFLVLCRHVFLTFHVLLRYVGVRIDPEAT